MRGQLGFLAFNVSEKLVNYLVLPSVGMHVYCIGFIGSLRGIFLGRFLDFNLFCSYFSVE